jgi:hypothetical protein
MNRKQDREALRQAFLKKADAAFGAAVERAEREQLDLSQLEELVEQLRLQLAAELLESILQLQPEAGVGPGPACSQCGQAMRSKGKKRRKVITSQGEVTVNRAYYFCEGCEAGLFPPGSPLEDQPGRLE